MQTVLLVFVVVVLVLGIGAVEIDWNWSRQISPRGGRYFFHRVELAVPSFRQGDEKWNDDPLGGVPENGTIGGEGCAVAAAAMVFKFYGIDVDPQQLNWFLSSVGGYTERGWLYWDRAAWFAPSPAGWPVFIMASRKRPRTATCFAIPIHLARCSICSSRSTWPAGRATIVATSARRWTPECRG